MFIYNVLQGDNFLAGYFYIFELFFYSGIFAGTVSFPLTKKEEWLYSRICRKSRTNFLTANAPFIRNIATRFSFLDGFNYMYMIYNNMCNNVVVFQLLAHFILIDHFRDIPMDSQTTEITHFAVVFHYDVTIKALETLRSTANNLWRHTEKQWQSAWCP